MSAEDREVQYAYLDTSSLGAKVHIVDVNHGVVCRPKLTRYWTPSSLIGFAVEPHDNLWITLVAAHTLCARCRKQFEAEHQPGLVR